MADINLNGINTQYITLKKKADTSFNVGDFITITSNFEACPIKANSDIVGKCVNIRNDIATIQISGFMTAILDDTESINRGYGSYGIDTNGKLVSLEGARKILVIGFDNATSTVSFLL